MQILGIIPARYGSTRFPGKPLASIHGKSMIQRVVERAAAANSLDHLIVATDDERIADEARKAGAEAVLTRSDHNTGTERCLEAATKTHNAFDVIINIQGDEPYIHPQQIDELCGLFENPDVLIGTLVKPFSDLEEIFDQNKVKVVLDKFSRALYFSRAPVPFVRNPSEFSSFTHFKHVGIYGYRSQILKEIVSLPSAWPEEAEALEQLRWLYHGIPIYCRQTEYESWSVDSPEDITHLPRE